MVNPQLLEATQNIEKGAIPFENWLERRFHHADEKSNFLIQNHIRLDQDLSLNCFSEFMAERRSSLKNKLTELLGTK